MKDDELFDLPTRPPRAVEVLTASALSVIDRALKTGAATILPLLSGGHDSLSAVHVASRHPRFDGVVHHINTRIGTAATRSFVEAVCKEFDWRLVVWESSHTYEQFVRERGFPGPGRHHWVYARIKERCIRQMTKGQGKVVLLTGCRSQESGRRMGHVEPVKVGEVGWKKVTAEQARRWKSRGVPVRNQSGGKWHRQIIRDKNRVWTAPCHDWSAEEQVAYMAEHDLPKNPLKLSLGMSGECFCGAFAAPGEIDRIRAFAPDVAAEIDRLTAVARECGTHDKWGTRPPEDGGGVLGIESGPLCSSCDIRARHAGLIVRRDPPDGYLI